MIFVDTNVFMYAVGSEHPLRERAERFFLDSVSSGIARVTSAEVLQELLHAYVPVGRLAALDAAYALVDRVIDAVWPIEAEDVRLARAIQTFDRALAAAFLKK